MTLSPSAAMAKDTKGNIPEFQHRHFAYIAKIISDLDLPWRSEDLFFAGRERIAIHFADGLAKSNPRFDRERFMRACRGF